MHMNRSKIMNNRIIVQLVGIAAVTIASSATAHHSAAMFDDKKCQSIVGTVRNLQWQHPHAWLWLVAPNENGGEGDIWGFELPPPSSLAMNPNWSRSSLQKGDKITVRFSPLRDDQHGGLANAIVLPNSSVLHAAPNAFACEDQYWRQGPSGLPLDAVPK